MIKDLTGMRFGRLMVLHFAGTNKYNQALWLCKCDCTGKEKIIPSRNLNDGGTKSCGCFRKEKCKTHPNSKTHGLKKHRLYYTWSSMMKRCYNPKCKDYKTYGKRGIIVCLEWHDIKNFVRDVEPLIIPGFTFHRKDNNKNYELSNVEYANDKTQANHRTNNHIITFNGKTQNLGQWADELKIGSSLLRARLGRLKWSTEKALTTPCKHYSLTSADLVETH